MGINSAGQIVGGYELDNIGRQPQTAAFTADPVTENVPEPRSLAVPAIGLCGIVLARARRSRRAGLPPQA